MSEQIKMYMVILERGGRMYPCDHKHKTPEEAHKCVSENNGLSIIEWVKDRKPQFQEFWTRPDLKPSNS